jgi:hypothetical protein
MDCGGMVAPTPTKFTYIANKQTANKQSREHVESNPFWVTKLDSSSKFRISVLFHQLISELFPTLTFKLQTYAWKLTKSEQGMNDASGLPQGLERASPDGDHSGNYLLTGPSSSQVKRMVGVVRLAECQ